jgi:hypothetical protein
VAGKALTTGILVGSDAFLAPGGSFAAAFSAGSAAFIKSGELALSTIKNYAIQAFEAVSNFVGSAVTTVQGWLGLAPAAPVGEGVSILTQIIGPEGAAFLDGAWTYAPEIAVAIIIIDAITGGAASEAIGDVVNGVGDIVSGVGDAVSDLGSSVGNVLGW